MFNSYEPGRAGYVTLIANYLPLQDAYGGPNYFKLDPNALYEIHIDNNGDAQGRHHLPVPLQEHAARASTLPIGGTNVADPADPGRPGHRAATPRRSNVNETFTVDVVRGDRRTGSARRGHQRRRRQRDLRQAVRQHRHRRRSPTTPPTPRKHIYNVNIPGCSDAGQGVRRPAQGSVRGQPRRRSSTWSTSPARPTSARPKRRSCSTRR